MRLLSLLLLLTGCAYTPATSIAISARVAMDHPGYHCYITSSGVVVDRHHLVEKCPPLKVVNRQERALLRRVSAIPCEITNARVIFVAQPIRCPVTETTGCTNGNSAVVFLRGMTHDWGVSYQTELTHVVGWRRYGSLDPCHKRLRYPAGQRKVCE